LAIFSIPIREWVIYVPLLLSIPLFVFYPINMKNLKIKPERDGLILLFFALVSLVSLVLSVRDFIVPIGHDPISHAFWAKQIYDTGLIDFFYSPGLHILSALGMMVDGINVANYVLIITNIFNALTFVPIYLFVKSYFKDGSFAILSAAVFVIAPFPAKFFWAGFGKNAFVVGVGMMFILFFISTLNIPRIKKLLLLNFLVFVLILIHYPTAFIALTGLFILLISQEGSWKNLRHIFLGCSLGIVWGAMKIKYQLAYLEESIVLSSTSRTWAFNLANIMAFLEDISRQSNAIFFSSTTGKYIVSFGLLGLAIMLIISIKKKKYLWFMLIPVVNVLLMFFIEFIEKLTFFHIIYITQILFSFVFIYIGVAFLFGKVVIPFILDKWGNFCSILLVSLTILAVYSSYRVYMKCIGEQNYLNMVQESDLDLYLWMNNNIDEEFIILNNAQMGSGEDYVFASDGGAWISVFTHLETAMPYTDSSSINTHENYELYTNIRDENFSCEDIDVLLDKRIGYYYQGSKPVYGPQINIENSGEIFELLFSSGAAKIFKIVPCD
jgi:hypothetical protein